MQGGEELGKGEVRLERRVNVEKEDAKGQVEWLRFKQRNGF